MRMVSRLMRPALLAAWLCAGVLAAAHAQSTVVTAAPPQGVLQLSASAAAEVPRDLMSVSLAATREGTDAQTVQAALKQALDAALAEARKAARPGQVDVRTGTFTIQPRYAQRGGISGWQGTAELTLEGRDMPAIAQLTGRLPTMTVSRVGYGLSREAREKAEGDIGGQAIARFRERAGLLAQQFGYGAYTVREVAVNTEDGAPPVRMFRMQPAAAAADAATLPVEAGNGTVTVTVSGTVQMHPR
jgi:predicted secreted protein